MRLTHVLGTGFAAGPWHTPPAPPHQWLHECYTNTSMIISCVANSLWIYQNDLNQLFKWNQTDTHSWDRFCSWSVTHAPRTAASVTTRMLYSYLYDHHLEQIHSWSTKNTWIKSLKWMKLTHVLGTGFAAGAWHTPPAPPHQWLHECYTNTCMIIIWSKFTLDLQKLLE